MDFQCATRQCYVSLICELMHCVKLLMGLNNQSMCDLPAENGSTSAFLSEWPSAPSPVCSISRGAIFSAATIIAPINNIKMSPDDFDLLRLAVTGTSNSSCSIQ